MFVGLAKLHGLLLRLVLWLLKQPLVGLAGLVKASLALMGEEARRWAGVLMAGLMIWALCWVILQVAQDSPVAMLAVVLLGMGWLAAAFKALELTMSNRVWKVRQRQMFRKLSGIEDRLGVRWDGAVRGVAHATHGTPLGRVFESNRAADAKAEADTRAAEEQAEADRREAARQAEVQRAADAREQQRLDELAAAEPSPY